MMKRKRTGKSPLRLGPVLIHYRKDQNTYSGFLQNPIDLKPALQGMLSTGTDGEQALVNAIEAKLPNAHSRSLRCFRHLQDNFKQALTSYGMVGMQRRSIDEVFGKVESNDIYHPGLLDAESPEEFDVTLESLRGGWKERSDPTEKVFKWVISRDHMMKTRMIASVRRVARLPPMTKDSDIPSHFLTNDAEANNSRIKSVKKHTQSGFCGTIEPDRSVVKNENEEFSQAVAGVSADYIRKLSLATMEDLHDADGPKSFGWAAVTGCEKSKPTSRDEIGCHTEMLSIDVDGIPDWKQF